MASVLSYILRRFRPAEGWSLLVLAFAAVVCVQQAAASAQLPLPYSVIGWAGCIGLLLGRLVAGTRSNQRPAPDDYPSRWQRVRGWLRVMCGVCVFVVGLCACTLAVGKALPPPALLWRDGTTLLTVTRQRLVPRATPSPVTPSTATPVPEPAPVETPLPALSWDSIAFLQEALPRFDGELRAAPNAGEVGATLIAALASALLTWVGALLLGAGLRQGRNLLSWELPFMVALATTKLLGGGASIWLFLGLGTLLLLGLLTTMFQRERSWTQRHIDYAADIRLDVVAWGVGVLILALPLAAGLPFTFDNPLSQVLWAQFQPPSALQALERHIEQGQRPQAAPVARRAGSTLPEVALGVSLEDGPATQAALRIHTGTPLNAGPWPHYWRSRVLNIYTGSAWRSDALISAEAGVDVPSGTQLGLVEQDVTDLRPERRLVYGLPSIVAINLTTNSERLNDGSLAASTLVETATLQRYRVFSNLPEQTTPASPQTSGQAPPDMSAYLRVPSDVPLRVADLARTLTRDARTPTDKVLALESYLRGLPYTYQVEPLPDNGDAVDQFLFSMRAGYCTYYASSFAILARTLGIPARINVGYFTGAYDTASGDYLVYEGDAHAWPEVYLDGRWLPFEPTPVRPLPARGTDASEGQTPAPTPEPLPAPTLAERLWNYWPGIAALLVLVLALLAPWLPRRIGRTNTPQDIQRQLERRGARIGLPWPQGATLHEYGALLRPHLAGNQQALEILVDLIEEARYSERDLTAAQRGRLLMAWNVVRNRLRRPTSR